MYLFFFLKQKTAYEMRISDWSSDVCSSDLGDEAQVLDRACAQQGLPRVCAGRGPVGDVQLQVEIQRAGAFDVVAVACEHREAQVVADQRMDAPALPLHHQPFAA